MKNNIIGYIEYTTDGEKIHTRKPKNVEGKLEPIVHGQSSAFYLEPALFMAAVEHEWIQLHDTEKTQLDDEYCRIQYVLSQPISYDTTHLFYAIQRAYGHFDVYLRWESDDIMNATMKELLNDDCVLFEEYSSFCMVSSEYNMGF